MSEGSPTRPRNFFLNERHELARAERDGGGGPAKYGEIDWAAKSTRLGNSLTTAKRMIESSTDPMKERHFFLTAMPARSVPKVSKNKKIAPAGIVEEATHYAGEHSRVFRRLGMDLLDVDKDGVATVHATSERFGSLLATASALVGEGVRERARWATIDGFAAISPEYRIDAEWLNSLPKTSAANVVVEVQPLLSRAEVEDVVRAIVHVLKREAGELLTGSGVDFSGRRWFRGTVRKATLRNIAAEFFSVQALHPPHVTAVSAGAKPRRSSRPESRSHGRETDLTSLPTIAVVDTGVPTGHSHLAPYLRGVYRWPDAPFPHAGDHGSLVASRVVFGDISNAESGLPSATCRYLDVMVASEPNKIEDKAVAPALEAVVATYPDVRVFNLSFGEVLPISDYGPVDRKERIALVRDLDNYVFARDVIVVVAAGNSPKGIVPPEPYPLHIDNKAWQLGAWPSGLNTLTCGSLVGKLDPDGLVTTPGWPSPFCRIGPGMASSPVPEYGASGGNLGTDWSYQPGLGVWGCTASGLLEDHVGTSFAAPLLAREAAFAFQTLQRYCPPGGHPFGVTVKALLALTAQRRGMPKPVSVLADRTIGRGVASADRLARPRPESALFLWQGVIDGSDDIVRVQLPIPLEWLGQAQRPSLRLVCSWDPPVNDAVRDIWACRRISLQLRTAPDCDALHGSRGAHPSYPMIDRTYNLSPAKIAKLDPAPTSDFWLLEIGYEQIAEYYVGMNFSPRQRVAFAAELRDEADKPLSPQRAVQALPAASSMVRLSVPPTQAPTPIILRRG